jgi:hypothetical protein
LPGCLLPPSLEGRPGLEGSRIHSYEESSVAWSVPFKVVGVIQPSSKPKKGATKSLHNRSPPKPISQRATDNVPDVGFAFEKQPGHEKPQAGRNHSNHNHEQKSLAHRLFDRIALVSSVDVREHLPAGVADDEAGVRLPRRTRAAGSGVVRACRSSHYR